MRPTYVFLAVLALVAGSVGQSIPNGYVWTYQQNGGAGFAAPGGAASTYTNNGPTGTQCNALVKQDSSGNAVRTAGGETSGVIGVALAGCGTSGAVIVFFGGDVPVLFDSPSPTLTDYVGISSTAGRVTDSGSMPGSGQNIGQVRNNPFTGVAPANCNAGTGCYVHLEIGSGSGGGSGCTGGCLLLNPTGSQTIVQPSGQPLTIQGAPTQFAGGGNVNGIQVPDSASNAANNTTQNTAQLASGTAPGTNALAPTSYLPIWCANVAGTVYCTQFETLADQGVTYPSLTGGLVPIGQIVGNTTNCNSTTFIAGDQSGCNSNSTTVAFNNLQSGTNTTATLLCGLGCVIEPTSSTPGVINATNLYPNNYPSGFVSSNQLLVGGAVNGTFIYTTLPLCNNTNQTLQYNTTTRSFGCATVTGQTPAMVLNQCTSSSCPSSGITGTGANVILAQFSIGAGVLNVGKCAEATVWFTHTGSATVDYTWNFGGTGSVGGSVTGGNSPNSQNSSSTCSSGLCEAVVVVCASTTNTIYARARAMQTGSSQVAGNTMQNTAQTLSSSWNINFLFDVANTDLVLFNGGFLNYP